MAVFVNPFNSVPEFRLAMVPFTSLLPQIFPPLNPSPRCQKLFSPPPPSSRWLTSYLVDSILQGRHSLGLTHSVPFLHRHPFTADHNDPDELMFCVNGFEIGANLLTKRKTTLNSPTQVSAGYTNISPIIQINLPPKVQNCGSPNFLLPLQSDVAPQT